MAEDFEYESYQDTQHIGSYLKALIEGIEKGKITFSSDENTIVLYPTGLLQFCVKARRKDNKNKLNIKLSWKDMKSKDLVNDKITIA